MQPQQGPGFIEIGLLGKQIKLLLAVHEEPHRLHLCHVRHEELPSAELLTGSGERAFLTYDSLPGTLNVKAIGRDSKDLFIELSPVDWEALIEEPLPDGVVANARGLWRGRRKLASYLRSTSEVEAEHGARALWIVPWKKLSSTDLDAAIIALDAIDLRNAYELEAERVEPTASHATGKPQLELRMGLQLQLVQTQVPVMSIAQMPDQQMCMDLEMTQMLRFEHWLNRNPVQAIEKALVADPSPAGQNRLAQYIAFKLARDVRAAVIAQGRDITWREARQIVRKKIFSRSSVA